MQSVFLPRTTLSPDESRFNYSILDNPALDLLISEEAINACSKMSTIYLRLRRAPWKWFEKSGVLLIHGDGTRTAWEILCELAGVASATLNKAIQWMKEKKVIGYWAGKNNTGIRIFFNVAAGSIRKEQKNLRLVPTSSDALRTSANEAAFIDSFAIKSIQDSDNRAGARAEAPPAATTPELQEMPLFAALDESAAAAPIEPPPTMPRPPLRLVPPAELPVSVEVQQAIIGVFAARLSELEQLVREMARTAVTWQWLQKAGLPQMARVSAETTLRMLGGKKSGSSRALREVDVGASQPVISPERLAEMEAAVRGDPQFAHLYDPETLTEMEEPHEQKLDHL